MKKVGDFLKKKAEIEGHSSTEDAGVSKKLSQGEIKGRRKDGKMGESREECTKRVCAKWRKAIYNQIVKNRSAELNDLKNFPYEIWCEFKRATISLYCICCMTC